jgi:hypothetical protein
MKARFHGDGITGFFGCEPEQLIDLQNLVERTKARLIYDGKSVYLVHPAFQSSDHAQAVSKEERTAK